MVDIILEYSIAHLNSVLCVAAKQEKVRLPLRPSLFETPKTSDFRLGPSLTYFEQLVHRASKQASKQANKQTNGQQKIETFV